MGSHRAALGRATFVMWFLACMASLPARACDTCGCSIVPMDEEALAPGWVVSVAEQFTDFSKLQQDGTPVANSFQQRLDSAVTLIVVGYNVDKRLGFQLTVPYISRSFTRQIGGQTQAGTAAGFGDVNVGIRYQLSGVHGTDGVSVVNVTGGFKLPTGSPDFLREQAASLQGAPDSVVGGHDLALGSGSLDEFVGGNWYCRRGKFVVAATVQYAFRNPGSFGYRYANEFQWNIRPGAYLKFDSRGSTALELDVEGQTKGTDTFNGTTVVTDTGIDEIYVGPRLEVASHNGFSGSLDIVLPVHQLNTDLQLVPACRVHASLSKRF